MMIGSVATGSVTGMRILGTLRPATTVIIIIIIHLARISIQVATNTLSLAKLCPSLGDQEELPGTSYHSKCCSLQAESLQKVTARLPISLAMKSHIYFCEEAGQGQAEASAVSKF